MGEGEGEAARVLGLCVVINGNLKQRELTISFFISSPMLRGERTPTRAARARVCMCGAGGMPFAPTTRVDLLLEGGKRASERKGAPRGAGRSNRIGTAVPSRGAKGMAGW